MKRLAFIVLLCVLAACSKSDEATIIQITATAEPATQSRAQIIPGDAGKMQIIWSAGDQFALYVNPDNIPFTLLSGASSPVATFSGEHPVGTACDDGGWAALYPYQTGSRAKISMSSDFVDTFGCELPAYQRATDNSFDRNSFLMLAHSATLGDFSFKPLVALLKVTPQFGCKQIILSARQSDPNYARIAGCAGFIWNGGDPLLEAGPTFNYGFNSSSIVLSGNITAGNDYYICVLPMTIPDGFDLIFLAEDGTQYVRGFASSFTPARGKIYDMGSFSTDGTPWTQVKPAPDANGHPYVDLGLVIDGQKVYFADRNVGADAADATGDYYYWGSTKPYPSTTYYDPYRTAVDIGGDATYDVAAKDWGGAWRMPAQNHLLFVGYETPCVDWIDVTWDTTHAIAGYTLTSRVPGYEGVSLFLPAAGYLDGGSPVSVGESGKYWYSNYYYGNSFGSRTYKFNYLNLNSFEKTHTYFGQGGYNHYFSIRPVMVQ